MRNMTSDDWNDGGNVQNPKKEKIKQQIDRLEREIKNLKVERENFFD